MRQPKTISPPLVLASTSPFRQALLQKLGLAFSTYSPEIDESSLAGEAAPELVCRLAREKAGAARHDFPSALIIGSDQVAALDDRILGKPGSREHAIEQLRAASGQTVVFYTGLTLLNSVTGRQQTLCEPFSVHFRSLDEAQIARYVDIEAPYNCAGSFKSEGLGIALFQRLQGDDPNALIGLPLIRLVQMLAEEQIQVP